MAIPLLLPIIGYSVLSVLVSYVAVRLYRSRGAYSNVLPNPVSSFKLDRTTWWDCRRSLTWTWPTSRKKAKPSKHMTVDLLPVTGLPPPPTALPITPPLVDIPSVSIPRTPSSPSSFHQPINKQVHSLHPTSFPRPPSPHALLATTSPQKHPRRSRSLGGVPVRRLSGGASGLRNVQFLDRDIEMQKMDRSTSKEHLLIDFSSSGSSDEPDVLRRENEEEGVISRRISPASSDIGVLPAHCRPSLFYDPEVSLVDLAPGRKVLPLVDLGDVEDGLSSKKEDDMWKWFVPPVSGKISLTPLESTPVSMLKPISKSISEPLPTTSIPLPMSEGILIDFHSEPDQEHVLVDLDVQHDNNVPQQGLHESLRVHTTHVDFDAAVSKPPITTDKAAVSLDDPPIIKSALEGRRSLDSLMKPITIVDITTPDPIPVEISSSSVEESSQRGRRVDRHPLEEVHEVEIKAVPEKAEASPAMIEEKKQNHEELVNDHELYDHHNDNYAFDKYHDHDNPQSLDTNRASSSSQVSTIPVQAAPAWYWDHEDDPWNGAVVVVNEEGGRDVEEELSGEREGAGSRGRVEEGDEKGVDLMEADLEVGEDEDVVKISPDSKALELPVEHFLEEVPTETEDEQSYPDPDYLPLPELLSGPSSPAVATEIPLVLVEDESQNNFQENEENQNNQDEDLQQSKDDEKSPRRAAAQMPTPPASPPPTSPLRVKGLGGEPPSPNSLSSMGGLLPLASLSPLTTLQSTSLKLGPSFVLTPPNTASLSPAIEIKIQVPEEDKENARVDKGNVSPNSATGRPLWSIRADDAPALGLAASSLSTTSSAGLIPGVGTNMGGSPRTRRRVLGDVTAVVENGETEEKVKEDTLKNEKDEENKVSPLPGAFPELVKPTTSPDTDVIVAPTITIAALTSTLLTTSIAAASSSISSISTPTSSTTALETSPPTIKRRPIARSPLDIALAMQLRPGLGVGADPAWMVRFLMAMFGWFAILVSGQGEF